MKRSSVFATLLMFLALGGWCAAAQVELSAHPRVVLNPRRLAKLKSLVRDGDERFLKLRAQGQAGLYAETGKYLSPGHARGTWSEAATSYALLYMLETKDELRKSFAEEALVYMKALCDDYEAVGDGKGGPRAVQDDKGYPLRNHGVGLVTACDWLWSYEGFSMEQKTIFALRLNEWIDWYEGHVGQEGTHVAEGPPWDDYFAAYFATKALTAAVTYELNPKAKLAYLKEVLVEMQDVVLPQLLEKLNGGYPCDGWAYRCGYDRTIEALLTLENATGKWFDKRFFDSVVHAMIHSTKPDRKHIYDGGDWPGKSTGYPLPLALMARLSRLLEGTRTAAHARFYVEDFALGDEFNRMSPAESLVFFDPSAERLDFTVGGKLSHWCPGTGMVFYRSSWKRDAFWGSFQSGSPHLSVHQNTDQGHITLNYRGRDLLIDAGMWREEIGPNAFINNYAKTTTWHNTIIIDDLGRETGLSQGTHGEGKTVAFEDRGKYVYARADFTGAYAYYPERKDSNSARMATREVWYIRPRALVVIDDVEPLDGSYPVSVLWHLPYKAQVDISGVELTARNDSTVLKLFFMLPQKMKIGLFKQFGTTQGDDKRGFHTRGARVTDATNRHKTRFVTVASARPAGRASSGNAPKGEMNPLSMDASCVVINALDRFVAVARAPRPNQALMLKMPLMGKLDLYVSGLKPNSTYTVKTIATSILKIRVIPTPSGTPTSPAGVLATSINVAGFRTAPRRAF